jgi:hypothetical protein
VRKIATDVWGDLDGVSRTRHVYGKGLVVWGLPLPEVLASLGVEPDVEYGHPLDGSLAWLHRRTDDAEIYYLASQYDRPDTFEVRFRVAGKAPEIWHPDTGLTEPAAYGTDGDRTTARVPMAERDAVFVVFRRPTSSPSRTLPLQTRTTLATVEGPWEVTFPPDLGAPPRIRLDSLQSWTVNADPGVKYFSGTATYTRALRVPPGWSAPGARIFLDLGRVGDIAQVTVNGKDLGILWKPPYAVDVTDALRPGTNRLEIRVTNEWTNRIAGDRVAPEGQKVLASGPPTFGPARPRPLPESGLLGPVEVVRVDGQP